MGPSYCCHTPRALPPSPAQIAFYRAYVPSYDEHVSTACMSPTPDTEEPKYQHGQQDVAQRIREGRASRLAAWPQGTTATATALRCRLRYDSDVHGGWTRVSGTQSIRTGKGHGKSPG